MTPVKNRSGKRLSRHTLANGIFLVVALFAVMTLSGRENHARRMRQNDESGFAEEFFGG